MAKTTIYKPLNPPVELPNRQPGTLRPTVQTSTRATKQISEQALRGWLEAKTSPLAPFSSLILQSPHWSTIISICTIEQYGCSKAPGFSPFNFWGIMRPGGGLARYSSYEEGISAIAGLLERYESRGYDTIEKLNGYYVQPASATWYSVVTDTKRQLESL